jgi:hypothetical protein
MVLAADEVAGMATGNGIAAAIGLVVLFGTIWLAERMHAGPRRILLALVGLALGAVAYELARFDHGLGIVLAFGAMVFAPVLVIFGGAAWAVRRLYGWPDLGDGPPRAAWICLFVLLGMLLGTQRRAEDVRATQALADEQAFDLTRPAAQLPRTRLGWWDPPRLRRGRDEEGRVVVAFPLAEMGTMTPWMWRVAGEAQWRHDSSARPPVTTWEPESP